MAIQEVTNWAFTRSKQAIALYHSQGLSLKKPSAQRPLLLIGGVHGDEPEGVVLAQETLNWLKTEEKKIQLPWILIPCWNVDGFANNSRTNAAGVDLNRNYPAKSWSPEIQTPRYHPGPSPGSEPEVQAMANLILQAQPRLVIHCHSWHPCIIVTGEPGRRDGERLARSSGYELKATIGYDTPGSLSQFAWHDHGIPVICIEEQEGTPLDQVWPHFAPAIKEIFLDTSDRRPSS